MSSCSNDNRNGEFHKIYALNRGKLKCIGTVRGRTYVKGVTYNSLLHHPCLMAGIGVKEMEDIRGKGAEFIKLERSDENTTHAISLADFLKHSEMRDRGWGLEYECPIHFFETSKKISRAASLNSPPVETSAPLIRQMPLFGERPPNQPPDGWHRSGCGGGDR